jgi:large subunit ribosomal protein L14e
MLSVGRICMKTAGREAGKFCVIVDTLEDGFLLVTGPKAVTSIKRRKCNSEHLEPTPEAIKIKKGATDDEVMAAYKREGVFKKLQAKEPTEREISAAKEAERKRLAAAKSKPKEARPAEKEAEKPREKAEEKKEEPKEKEGRKEEKKHEEKKEREKPEKKDHKDKPAKKKGAPKHKKAHKKPAKKPAKKAKPKPKKK